MPLQASAIPLPSFFSAYSIFYAVAKSREKAPVPSSSHVSMQCLEAQGYFNICYFWGKKKKKEGKT